MVDQVAAIDASVKRGYRYSGIPYSRQGLTLDVVAVGVVMKARALLFGAR